MTQPKTRYRTYQDHRGNSVRVRQTQDREGRWVEHWSVAQLMQVDLSNEPDPQEQPPVVFRTASKPSDRSQPHLDTPTARRASKNNSNINRKGTHRG